MLRSGEEYLESLRDGRALFIGNERVRDVTAHPAFRGAAHMYAALYDLKGDAAHREVMSFEEDGERFSIYFLRPRSREDLERRTAAHRVVADFSYGMLGRSPDHVASSITGLSLKPEVLDAVGPGYAQHLVGYYEKLRREDLFAVYAVLPPQGARNPALYESQDRNPPTLRVTSEDDDGVVLNGMKMLATGAAFCNELWVGNILPLAPSQVKESVTCAIAANTPGLMLWSRRTFEDERRLPVDAPVSHHFDESDCMLVFRDVKVPWERVFVHDDPTLSREIYVRTPAHVMANHQSNVRFWSKLRLMVGLASRVAESNGAHEIPAVREILGRLAAMEAGFAGIIAGQHHACESLDSGHVVFNRRFVYAAVNWAMEHHSELVDMLRTLSGGGVFQMPASSNVARDPELNALFEEYWATPTQTAEQRMRLFRVAWDLMGSELAGRHQLYEKFYVGPSFVVRNYNFVNAPWDELHHIVDGLAAGRGLPE